MATITTKYTTTKIPAIKISLTACIKLKDMTLDSSKSVNSAFGQLLNLKTRSIPQRPSSHLLPLYPCSTPLIALPPVSQFSISIRIAIAVSPCITQGRQPCSGASVPHTFRPGRKCLPSTIHKTGCHSPIIGLYRGHAGYKRRMSV